MFLNASTIVRYALFEGRIMPGLMSDFRRAIVTELLPMWKQFPSAVSVRLSFAEERDAGAPEYPLILAVTYPDREALELALKSPIREQSRIATQRVLARYFLGHIHHHITTSTDYPAFQESEPI